MARRHAVIAAALVVTLLLGSGVTQLEYRTDINEWLPTGDPNVIAFNHVLADLHGVANLEVVYVELDEDKTTVGNVTSEEAIRAQHALYEHIRARVPEAKHVYGLPHWVMLVNYANHNNDPAHYRLPESSAEFQAAWETVWRTNRETVELSVSKDWRGAWMGVIFDAEPGSQDARRVGRAIEAAVEDYKADPDAEGDIWQDRWLRPYGLTSGTARIDTSVQQDVLRLGPAAVALIAAGLWLAFRSRGAVAAALATLATGVAWVYGLMGWLGIELSIANIALVPLVLGNGIDYAIHVLNRFQEETNRGAGAEEAFRAVGRLVGVPLVLSTTTTVARLLTTALSTIPGMVELGLLAALAMLVTGLLSLTLLPALASLTAGGGQRFRPLPALGAFAEAVSRRRGATIAAVLAVTALLAWNSTNAYYLIDMVEGNFPEGDPFLETGLRIQDQIHATSVEWIILEGDVTDPEALEYIRAVEEEVYASGLVARRANVQSLVSLLGNYETLKDGSAGALPHLARGELTGETPRDRAPTDRATIEGDIAAMYADPAWAPVTKILVSEDQDLTVILVVPSLESSTYDAAGGLWGALTAAVEAAEPQRPDDVEVHIYGYRTIPYHFVNYAKAQLKTLFLTSLATAGVLIYAFTRRPRAVLAVAAPMAASAVWWYGILPSVGIYVSVFLLFPMVFITSIGSDYAAHLVWGLHRGEGRRRVFSAVGKAVTFSALTDAGAFGVFALMYLASAGAIMRGASVAIVAAAAATLALTPLLWRDVEPPREPEARPVAAPVASPPAAVEEPG